MRGCLITPNTDKENMNVIVKDRPNDREADHNLIRQGLRSADPNDRRQARIAQDRLNMESAKVRSMREALIKAHRNGDKDEIADIHDFVERRSEYKNGW